ncbi:hypothetical protein FRACYDRAFT_235763 [Fragilariopsis cylindrus CCMP1102]|uniref:Uncharacterized protein n=1 Tax=Fragilariopsis cylindrus CCMP1102 TaxID=635003 RepID=A0A1E7FNJ0_9STRA|nr:hypothetical protein FRACYDRAFT_235763 [Fragilariopsis cylindrus CCMP1102]|eukprot:OEU19707.1 hypothetical protein FRACYDRAFT_235763 [Fragilariopsis cylindrus CCMP1102]
MGKLFLKRSQATSNGGGTSTAVRGATSSSSSSSSNSFTNSFRRRGRNRSNNQQQQQQQRVKPLQGSEAVAAESQQVNAKTFKYPMEGFETWIEHSLLDSFNDTTKAVEAEVSYAQLTALLALAGEEWSSTSEVPQALCKAISKQIIKYANKHDLDRQQELKELLNPLIDYAKGRGRKQAIQMLPWFAALTVSTINPLAFYATYMSMLAANSDALSKGDRADRNTIDMAEMGNRHGNVEKASLLDEDHYNESDDEDNDE